MPISKETQINQLREKFFTLKSLGFSDAQFASALGIEEVEVRKLRHKLGIEPVYKMIDTCAAEFESFTPYYYSTDEAENEALDSQKDKVIILGGGPNRIGQGIEFDYCCVHASMALREAGYETIMVNSNPTICSNVSLLRSMLIAPSAQINSIAAMYVKNENKFNQYWLLMLESNLPVSQEGALKYLESQVEAKDFSNKLLMALDSNNFGARKLALSILGKI